MTLFYPKGMSEEWTAVHHHKIEGFADTHTYITKHIK